MAGGLLDVKAQYSQYGAYHHDTMNKLIHILCVWPILWASMALASQLDPVMDTPPLLAGLPFGEYIKIHPLSFTVPVYILFYLSMEPFAGMLGSILVIICNVSSNMFMTHGLEMTGGIEPWKVALGIKVGCWIAQFVGHGVFEKRAPALFDNLLQAVLMAPLFVLLEVLFMFGYRPQLQKEVDEIVMGRINEWKAGKKQA